MGLSLSGTRGTVLLPLPGLAQIWIAWLLVAISQSVSQSVRGREAWICETKARKKAKRGGTTHTHTHSHPSICMHAEHKNGPWNYHPPFFCLVRYLQASKTPWAVQAELQRIRYNWRLTQNSRTVRIPLPITRCLLSTGTTARTGRPLVDGRIVRSTSKEEISPLMSSHVMSRPVMSENNRCLCCCETKVNTKCFNALLDSA